MTAAPVAVAMKPMPFVPEILPGPAPRLRRLGARRFRALWLSLAVLGAAGCAGDGPASCPQADAFSAVQCQVFDRNCLAAGCHNGVDKQGGLVLESGLSWAALVNQAPENGVAQDEGWLRVVPSDPERSFLLRKLTGVGPGEGSLMPRGAARLSDADIGLVRAWIEAGAPPPPGATPSPTPVDQP